MWIKRDFLENLALDELLEAIFIRGPRQIGKSSILTQIKPKAESFLSMDDISLQQKAMTDPAFLPAALVKKRVKKVCKFLGLKTAAYAKVGQFGWDDLIEVDSSGYGNRGKLSLCIIWRTYCSFRNP